MQCPFHKVPYNQSHAACMRKFMGIPDPGGPATGDGELPDDVMAELKKRYTVKRSYENESNG
jgi:hypothetical protein